MININSDFSDPEVFNFLQKSFQSLHPIYGGEKCISPSGLLQEETVRIMTPLGVPLIGYAQRIIEITESSSLETGESLSYLYRRGFRRTPELCVERISMISVHRVVGQNSPLGHFSGPILIGNTGQDLDWNVKRIAMLATSVLRDIGRVLKCEPPEIPPNTIKCPVFSVNIGA